MSPADFKLQFIDDWKPTPLIKIEEIWFKHEDFNPTGSVKSRGLVWQIYYLLQDKIKTAVISSSGNAAIAASYYAQKAGIQIISFVPNSIPAEKLNRLKEYCDDVIVTEKASEKAEIYAKTNNLRLIRQSMDLHAREGFQGLALELSAQMHSESIDLSNCSIFFPVSSGTTVTGFYQGIQNNLLSIPQIHIAQTEAVNLIAKEFDQQFTPMARSIAKGIVASKKENTYSEDVIRLVNETHGSGWVVCDQQINNALTWLLDHNIKASVEGALALAGIWKAQDQKFQLKQYALVILT